MSSNLLKKKHLGQATCRMLVFRKKTENIRHVGPSL
jgi:hypothetical protein